MSAIQVLLLATFTQIAWAQVSIMDASQEQMIAAELAFVRMASQQNTRDAFYVFPR